MPSSFSEITGCLPGAFVILQGVVIKVIETKKGYLSAFMQF